MIMMLERLFKTHWRLHYREAIYKNLLSEEKLLKSLAFFLLLNQHGGLILAPQNLSEMH